MRFIVVYVVSILLFACGGQNEAAHKIVLPEAGSPGAAIYKKFCSACHAPPRIASHKADEWLNIVGRMQLHRIKNAYNPLNESEKDVLVAYLKKHSVN